LVNSKISSVKDDVVNVNLHIRKLKEDEFESFTEKLKTLVDDKNKSEKDVAKFIKETHRSVVS